nr:serine/threonine-protein kinase 11-interacting protein [Quercus suber]
MAIVTGDRYQEKLVKFVESEVGPLLDGTVVLKVNPTGLHYVQSRLEALRELEGLLAGAPVDYLRAYVSDLGDHRSLEQLRRILRLLPSLKVVSVLPPPSRDPMPLSLLPFGRLRVLELRGCDLSSSAARGLLELRHTLEKIICHNSTDALRHVFASRIAEIKDSPQWNRLSFVSCACNGLVLMDESLQLLPVVETLDLSRNKFAKVDNLRKCAKLKHLDLGFNHLRSISYFTEVSCHIVKLVLRNNALTSLHGIENLKSLEGLDVSYNIISSFSDIEFLTDLPSLRSLWLEGNPLCCARWYRAQVFSFFMYPEKLKLDDKNISTREFWKRQIIVASRQKRPASFGFYSPAKVDAKEEGSINPKRRKVSRLASIGSEEESTGVFSDQESVSCDIDIQSRADTVISEDEAEIVDLMNRVELMKKERSVLWLREFKEWMDHASETSVDRDTSTGLPANPYFSQIGLLGISGGDSLVGLGRMDTNKEHLKTYSHEGINIISPQARISHPDTGIQGGHRVIENLSVSPLSAIDDISESHSTIACPGSPPHYQEDILHRRHNLVEEIMQLSAESYSVASSDSNTSCSDDDSCESIPEFDKSANDNYLNRSAKENSSPNDFENKDCDQRHEIFHVRENGEDFPAVALDDEIAHFVNQEADYLEKRKGKRKMKKRIISLVAENNVVGKTEPSHESNRNLDFLRADMEPEQGKQISCQSELQEVTHEEQMWTNRNRAPTIDASSFSGSRCSSPGGNDFIENYFNINVADSSIHETCQQYLRCDCVLEPESKYKERRGEVVLLLSSENKFYVLLIGVTGSIISLLGCHKVEDIREVSIGLGLQVVRVYIDRGSAYVFITRSIQKSSQLLSTLKVFDPHEANDSCSLRSLEQVQVELFEKQIYGGLKVSIFQYSMVLFWHNNNEEVSWHSRSLFVIGDNLLICIEDLVQFSSLSMDSSLPPYFSVDSYCSIVDISEMVIETRESWCVTVALKCTASVFCSSAKADKKVAAINDEKTASSPVTWMIRWFSEDSLFQFVALVKAIHAGTSMFPLLVKWQGLTH